MSKDLSRDWGVDVPRRFGHYFPVADDIDPPEPEVPAEVRERWRQRRRGVVAVLRALCALPALMILYYAFFPKVHYTYRVTLAAPGATPGRTLDVGDVRFEARDRALGLVAIDGAGRDRAGAVHVVVRNNIKSAGLYQRLQELERPSRVLLTLQVPETAGPLVLPLDSWRLDVVTTSDYVKQLSHRLVGLLLGLVLVGLAVLLIPRLVHVLWPDR